MYGSLIESKDQWKSRGILSRRTEIYSGNGTNLRGLLLDVLAKGVVLLLERFVMTDGLSDCDIESVEASMMGFGR